MVDWNLPNLCFLQSSIDWFDIDIDKVLNILVKAGSVLTKEGVPLSRPDQTYVRKGVGKFMYMMQWVRTEISQSTRDLSKHMATMNALHKAIESLAYIYSWMGINIHQANTPYMAPHVFWQSDPFWKGLYIGS